MTKKTLQTFLGWINPTLALLYYDICGLHMTSHIGADQVMWLSHV